MQLKSFESYQETLYHCRFCPMCKPAADVANVTNIESHSTRGRAVLLWRIATGKADFTKRSVELLYQSTLDRMSESWCINHFEVSDYVLSARSEVAKKGLLPDSVKKALELEHSVVPCAKGETIFLASEAAEMGAEKRVKIAIELLKKLGISATVYQQTNGAISYSLGDMEQAKGQVERLIAALKTAGAKLIIADGPKTVFALTKMVERLGVTLPAGMKVTSLSEVLHQHSKELKVCKDERTVFFHDGQSAAFLGDTLATDGALQPYLHGGSEDVLGTGAIYTVPRDLVDKLGMKRAFGVWSRSLAKSCGVEDALWITYPKLAEQLAHQRLGYVKDLGAEALVTDSLLSAEYLSKIVQESGEGIEVMWLPELYSCSKS